MNKILRFVPLLAAGALASGCNDFDYGVTADAFKQKEYAENFEKVFGTPDPNQDWSMAATITANVNMSGNVSVAIYSENPNNANAKVLASFTSKTATFNGIKGYTQVYAMVFEGSKVVAKGYYDIKDGVVEIGNSAQTRAGGTTPVCESYNHTNGGVDGVVTTTSVEGATVPFPIVWKDGTTEEYKTEYFSAFDYTLYRSNNFETKGANTIENFYQITNLETTPAPGQSLNLMYNLYEVYTKKDGTKVTGPFKEGANQVKKYLGEKDEHTVDLQKDALLTTLGGETTLTYVGKGTDHNNDIGYFYYPKASESDYYRSDGTLDFDKVPKFVCFKDMSNTGDLLSGPNPYNNTQTESYNTERFQTMVALSGREDDLGWQEWIKTSSYVGTTFKLAYFGDDATQTGTYDFPADYVVGFFGVKTGGDNSQTQDKAHVYCSVASVEKNYFNDFPRGATFKFKGNTYMGLEDNNDYDINDYLFVLTGFDDDDVPDVTPDADPEPETETVETETSWIYASEDLGGTFDYDFNDVVWAVVNKYEVTRNKATKEPVGAPVFKSSCIRLLACGGTLPVQLLFDEAAVGGKELHQQFGQQESELYQANVSPSPVDVALPNTEAIVIDDTFNARFAVKVKNDAASSTYVTAPRKGESAAPQILVLTGEWEWPTEGTPITTAYPEFTNWTKDVEWSTWDANKAPNTTVSRTH